MSKREEIAPNGDKRYIRRDAEGRIKSSVEEGASLSADSRHNSKTDSKPGQGDRGDHQAKKIDAANSRRAVPQPAETGER